MVTRVVQRQKTDLDWWVCLSLTGAEDTYQQTSKATAKFGSDESDYEDKHMNENCKK